MNLGEKNCHQKRLPATLLLAEREEKCIHETLQKGKIFVVIDKTEINGKKFINCLVGNIGVPAVTILADCSSLENSVSSTAVTQIFDDVRRKLDACCYYLMQLVTCALLERLLNNCFHVWCISLPLHIR